MLEREEFKVVLDGEEQKINRNLCSTLSTENINFKLDLFFVITRNLVSIFDCPPILKKRFFKMRGCPHSYLLPIHFFSQFEIGMTTFSTHFPFFFNSLLFPKYGTMRFKRIINFFVTIKCTKFSFLSHTFILFFNTFMFFLYFER